MPKRKSLPHRFRRASALRKADSSLRKTLLRADADDPVHAVLVLRYPTGMNHAGKGSLKSLAAAREVAVRDFVGRLTKIGLRAKPATLGGTVAIDGPASSVLDALEMRDVDQASAMDQRIRY